MLSKCSFRTVFHCLYYLPTNINFVRFNHYKALGLSPTASLADIKDAYYKLSKIHHPDRNNGSSASAKKFRDIVAAYEILSKTESRKKYDTELVKKLEENSPDFASRKKGIKKIRRTPNSTKGKSSQLKNGTCSKIKTKKSRSGVERNHSRDFETFIVRAIPLVVACLMCCKKR